VLGNLQLGSAVGPNISSPVTVAGTAAADGVPANATAVVTNVTAAHGTQASFLTVYPAGVPAMPTASNVNFTAGQAVANRVTVGVGTGGQIEVYNHAGTVNVDVDVDGYYSGSGGTVLSVGQLAVGVPEIELGQVVRQVLHANVVVRPIQAPLELGKVVLGLVGRHALADVLTDGVVDGTVPGHVGTDRLVGACAVCVECAPRHLHVLRDGA
jgi:hypothetical protein